MELLIKEYIHIYILFLTVGSPPKLNAVPHWMTLAGGDGKGSLDLPVEDLHFFRDCFSPTHKVPVLLPLSSVVISHVGIRGASVFLSHLDK